MLEDIDVFFRAFEDVPDFCLEINRILLEKEVCDLLVRRVQIVNEGHVLLILDESCLITTQDAWNGIERD